MEVIARNVQFTPSHMTKKWFMKSHDEGSYEPNIQWMVAYV
jgi:hypothetical protein